MRRGARRLSLMGMVVTLFCVALLGTGCEWNGVNSLALPGTVGTSGDDYHITVEIANVGTLSENSPVFVDDVEVGSVGEMRVRAWHAVVDVRLKKGTVVPGNAKATVGQTSLLGSMHLALDPPGASRRSVSSRLTRRFRLLARRPIRRPKRHWRRCRRWSTAAVWDNWVGSSVR
ncbi:MlaD family protein [Gordonia sp. SID5947]|uniref:MlaD family protein n=1 Tax=Gordonia sp. SID5947 TaxID=2690315 RepID=UPI001F3FCCC6|nr:MlaD family protein [Gordonia sp. SID5947]